MIDLDVELAISCKETDGVFKVYIIKNTLRIEITRYLSEYEIKSLKLRYAVKRELERPVRKTDPFRGPLY